MNYDFNYPTRLLTGEGVVAKNSALFPSLGKKCMIVTSGTAAKRSGALDDLLSVLNAHQIDSTLHDTVEPNPLLDDAYRAGQRAASEEVDFIVGIGGGSPLDASKAVAIFAANKEMDASAIFANSWPNKALPLVTIGTTAGTGSEINQYSILTNADGRKQSIAHRDAFPTIAFGDSRYTASVPLSVTLSTGLDALSHCVESYYKTTGSLFSDLYATEGIGILFDALSELIKVHSTDEISSDLRDRLYYASLLGGYAISQSSTSYCHSLGYFLTEEHHLPHGFACAVYLPGFIRREKKLMLEKTTKLEQRIGHTMEDLIGVIQQVEIPINVHLSAENIQSIVDSKAGAPQLLCTAPNGVDREEAIAILTDLFA